jgi:hypothetical protein
MAAMTAQTSAQVEDRGCREGRVCRLHDLIVVPIAEQSRPPEIADCLGGYLHLHIVVGIADDPQRKLADRQTLGVQV